MQIDTTTQPTYAAAGTPSVFIPYNAPASTPSADFEQVLQSVSPAPSNASAGSTLTPTPLPVSSGAVTTTQAGAASALPAMAPAQSGLTGSLPAQSAMSGMAGLPGAQSSLSSVVPYQTGGTGTTGLSAQPGVAAPAASVATATWPGYATGSGTSAAMPQFTMGTAMMPSASASPPAQPMSGCCGCCGCARAQAAMAAGADVAMTMAQTAAPAVTPAMPPAATMDAGAATLAATTVAVPGVTTLQTPFQGSYAVTQPFGPTSLAMEPSYDGYAHFHTGIDYGLPSGTAVDAAAPGRVVAAGWDNSGFGYRVIVDHGNGVQTLYGHLEQITVAAGQQVQAGMQLGLSGSTGNSSGPHLHFGVEKDGQWVDPASYLGAMSATTTTAPAALGATTTSAVAPPGTSPLPAVASDAASLNVGGAAGTGNTAGASGSAPTDLDGLIRQVSLATGVPASLIGGVVQAESSGNPRAVSAAGAKGLMQLMDSTAASYGVTNVFDPLQNLLGGASYLHGLLQRYKGDEQLALAAYNAGPAAVDQYGGIPPFAETQQYVQRVTGYQRAYAAGNGNN